ncbi:MAG: YiiX/YebB-like N1pC/P60 family cysteine hydrolase [Dokdonella sp.]
MSSPEEAVARQPIRDGTRLNPLRWVGRHLARYLSEPRDSANLATNRAPLLAAVLRKGDVLLVEGTSRFSSAIRTITQSTWSHAAIFVGDALDRSLADETQLFIEADINQGVRAMPLSHYARWHTRICRPVGLGEDEINALIGYVIARLGNQYDLRNVADLARYLLRPPPVSQRYRRRLLALGSGDPTRAICSSLIAGAFASINYPVLPDIELAMEKGEAGKEQVREILHIRHSSLYAPRDFDVSPYFRIVKPTIEGGFDPHTLTWAPALDDQPTG